MVATVINFIFTRTALGRWLDGRKTILSSCLLALAAVIECVDKLAVVFPQVPQFLVVSGELKSFLQAVASTLETLGFSGLVAGLTHKAAKAKLPDAK